MASRTSSSIASNSRDTKKRGTQVVIKTIRVLLSALGQRSRKSGGLTTWRTPWITAGRPGISSIATRPFRRSRRDPQCSATACRSNVSARAGIGRSRMTVNVSIPVWAGWRGVRARRTVSAATDVSPNNSAGVVSIVVRRGAREFRAFSAAFSRLAAEPIPTRVDSDTCPKSSWPGSSGSPIAAGCWKRWPGRAGP